MTVFFGDALFDIHKGAQDPCHAYCTGEPIQYEGNPYRVVGIKHVVRDGRREVAIELDPMPNEADEKIVNKQLSFGPFFSITNHHHALVLNRQGTVLADFGQYKDLAAFVTGEMNKRSRELGVL